MTLMLLGSSIFSPLALAFVLLTSEDTLAQFQKACLVCIIFTLCRFGTMT